MKSPLTLYLGNPSWSAGGATLYCAVDLERNLEMVSHIKIPQVLRTWLTTGNTN